MGPCSVKMTCLQSWKLSEVLLLKAFLSSEFDQTQVWGSTQVAIVILECVGHNMGHCSLLARRQWRKMSCQTLPLAALNSVDHVKSPVYIRNPVFCHCCNVSGSLTLFTAGSWAKLHEVVFLCKDANESFVESWWNEGSGGFYHRDCYQGVHATQQSKTVISLIRQPFNVHCQRLTKTR